MKRRLLILGMITCLLLGLSACGSEKKETAGNPLITEEQAAAYADQLIESINAVVQQGAEDQYYGDAVLSAAFSSWKSAQEDMGSYLGVLDHEVEIGEKSTIITTRIDGAVRDAEVEVILDKELALTSITTNVQYSFGELMTNAALNTVIGMGTVFAVLILICIIISAFVLIPRIQAAFTSGKKTKETQDQTGKETAQSAPVTESAAQVQEEELTDDLELVAVIAAAVAASEGAASTDGFVVRSIRRANTNKWQRA